nr:hypothetical protein Iba_chr04cCG5310 [Ipomoea batatas]
MAPFVYTLHSTETFPTPGDFLAQIHPDIDTKAGKWKRTYIGGSYADVDSLTTFDRRVLPHIKKLRRPNDAAGAAIGDIGVCISGAGAIVLAHPHTLVNIHRRVNKRARSVRQLHEIHRQKPVFPAVQFVIILRILIVFSPENEVPGIQELRDGVPRRRLIRRRPYKIPAPVDQMDVAIFPDFQDSGGTAERRVSVTHPNYRLGFNFLVPNPHVTLIGAVRSEEPQFEEPIGGHQGSVAGEWLRRGDGVNGESHGEISDKNLGNQKKPEWVTVILGGVSHSRELMSNDQIPFLYTERAES